MKRIFLWSVVAVVALFAAFSASSAWALAVTNISPTTGTLYRGSSVTVTWTPTTGASGSVYVYLINTSDYVYQAGLNLSAPALITSGRTTVTIPTNAPLGGPYAFALVSTSNTSDYALGVGNMTVADSATPPPPPPSSTGDTSWKEPVSTPPSCNPATDGDGCYNPVNVSTSEQTKKGNFNVGQSGNDLNILRFKTYGKVGAAAYCDLNGQNCSVPPFSGSAGFWAADTTTGEIKNTNSGSVNVRSGAVLIESVAAGNQGAFLMLRDSTNISTNQGALYVFSGSMYVEAPINGNIVLRHHQGSPSLPKIDRLVITPAGNVGIGTTNPQTKLHVVGNSTGDEQIIIENSNPSGRGAFLVMRDGTGINNQGAIYSYRGDLYLETAQDRNILFRDHVVRPGQEALKRDRMIIAGNGNVGIGTSMPTTKLDVRGKVQVAAAGGSAGGADFCIFNTTTGVNEKCLSSVNTSSSLPAGANSQTLRHNGVAWTASDLLNNDGAKVAVGMSTASLSSAYKLGVNGNTWFAGTLSIQGGTPGVNKILSSVDAYGNAVWKTGGEIFGACQTGYALQSFTTSGTPNCVPVITSSNIDNGTAVDQTIRWSGTKWTWSNLMKNNGVVVTLADGGGTIVSQNVKLDILGRIKIQGGNPGQGKVLTSDQYGNAAWENPFTPERVTISTSFTKIYDTTRWMKVETFCPVGSVRVSCSSYQSDCEEQDCGNHGVKPIVHGDGRQGCQGWFDNDSVTEDRVDAYCLR